MMAGASSREKERRVHAHATARTRREERERGRDGAEKEVKTFSPGSASISYKLCETNLRKNTLTVDEDERRGEWKDEAAFNIRSKVKLQTKEKKKWQRRCPLQ